MHDALLVGRVERCRNLLRDDECVTHAHDMGDAIAKRLTVDQLEDQRAHAHRLLDAIDGADVRIVQGRQRSRFSFEASQSIGIAGKRRRQHLDRDVASQPGIACAIDVANSPGSKDRDELVVAETRAGEGHDEETSG